MKGENDMFETKCPNCKEEALEVVSGGFTAEGVRLTKDGFCFDEAKHLHTENERVVCRECGKEFTLADLTM